MNMTEINPVWSALIKEGSRVDSLVASSLAYSLISTLRRKIGLKFWGVFGSLPGLGRATIVADNISSGKQHH